MSALVPQTAIPGTSQSSFDRLAKTLGYFSIALGLAEMAAPKAVCRAAGIDGHETLIRAYGAREFATGVAILMSHNATPWIWGRVAGDVADMATVIAGSQNNRGKKENVGMTLAVLAGVAALDLYCAKGLTAEKGNRHTAIADYSSRSGFPRGIEASRGAARDAEMPRDMRGPKSMQQDAFAHTSGRGNGAGAPAPI